MRARCQSLPTPHLCYRRHLLTMLCPAFLLLICHLNNVIFGILNKGRRCLIGGSSDQQFGPWVSALREGHTGYARQEVGLKTVACFIETWFQEFKPVEMKTLRRFREDFSGADDLPSSSAQLLFNQKGLNQRGTSAMRCNDAGAATIGKKSWCYFTSFDPRNSI